MSLWSDAMRIIENEKAAKVNRQRGEDYLRQLQIEKLQRELSVRPVAAGERKAP